MLRWLIVPPLLALGLMAPKWMLERQFRGRIVSPEQAPAEAVAVVFGAGLRRDGTPTAVLADRVDTAVALYRLGKVERLLMSGSSRPGYDEPAAMASRARSMGVPQEAILTDPLGFRTYATCARARQAGIRTALLVSQRFHLPRALALCQSMGLQAFGVPADRSVYSARARRFWALREVPASFVAWLETLLPTRGGPSPL